LSHFECSEGDIKAEAAACSGKPVPNAVNTLFAPADKLAFDPGFTVGDFAG
jgi:hypothetical protein